MQTSGPAQESRTPVAAAVSNAIPTSATTLRAPASAPYPWTLPSEPIQSDAHTPTSMIAVVRPSRPIQTRRRGLNRSPRSIGVSAIAMATIATISGGKAMDAVRRSGETGDANETRGNQAVRRYAVATTRSAQPAR